MALHDDVVAQSAATGILGAAARFHLARPGKEVRGRLAMRIAGALAVSEGAARGLATACELLHNASLVHDDVQDRDVVRRGRETVWSRFGEPIAINLGDHLIASAFRVLAEVDAPAPHRADLLAMFARATSTLAAGQSAEILRRDDGTMDCATYETVAAAKTGPLLALPIEGALLLAGSTLAQREAARAGAADFGVAFQILDDVADLVGRKQRLERGADLREGKLTWPMLIFLEDADAEIGDRFRAFLRGPRAARSDVGPWVQTLLAADVVTQSLDQVDILTARAMKTWQVLPPRVLDGLVEVTDSVAASLFGSRRTGAAQ